MVTTWRTPIIAPKSDGLIRTLAESPAAESFVDATQDPQIAKYKNQNWLSLDDMFLITSAYLRENAAPNEVGYSRGPTLTDVAALFGSEHDLRPLEMMPVDPINLVSFDSVGTFRIPGLGVGGEAGVGHAKIEDHTQTPTVDHHYTNFKFIIPMEEDVADRIDAMTLVLAPKNFVPEFTRFGTKTRPEEVAVPLSFTHWPAHDVTDRYGHFDYRAPGCLYAAAQIPSSEIKRLAGFAYETDVSFYGRIKTKDGQFHWMNPGGEAFKNFLISAEQITGGNDLRSGSLAASSVTVRDV